MKALVRFICISLLLLNGVAGFVYATDIDFVDAINGWAIVDSMSEMEEGNLLLHTSDGGKSWTVQQSESGELDAHACMDFVSPTEGWIVSYSGLILHTDDGGNTWNPQANAWELLGYELEYPEYEIHFVDSDNGWILMGSLFSSSALLHTSDGGQNWNLQESEEDTQYISMDFASPVEGWIIGIRFIYSGFLPEVQGVMLHTTDAGQTWTVQHEANDVWFIDVQFINSDEGWIIGYDDIDFSLNVFHTIDGGDTWISESRSYVEATDLYFTDSQNGWIVGEEILHTSDGGKTWVNQDSGLDEPVAAYFIDSNEGWLIGYEMWLGDMIFHTDDGGDTWEVQWPPPEVTSVSITEGMEVPGNAKITVEFSREMQSVDIGVSGAEGTTTLDLEGWYDDYTIATWEPLTVVPLGPHTLTVTGVDIFGCELKTFAPIDFIAIAPDTTPPAIIDANCDPANGAVNIDPSDYLEKIVVAFDEELESARSISKDPAFTSIESIGADGKSLEITFLFYSLPYNTEVTIGLVVSDAVGNTANVEYSFTTLARELSFFMQLEHGLSIVSVPLKPHTPYTARSLAELLSANLVIRYNEETRKFEGHTLKAPDEGFIIEGGKGYIVNVPEETGVVEFKGEAWTNEPPVEMAPAASQSNSAWAFVVSGSVLDNATMSTSADSYTAVVKNLHTGHMTEEAVGVNGYFAAAWADLNRKAVIEAGNRMEVTIVDTGGKIVSGPFLHEVTPDDIRNAVIDVRMMLGYVIPARSALFQNYPNPFNPETWIPYQLKDATSVSIRIYEVTGQLVRTLQLGYKDAGVYTSRSEAAYWDGRNEAGEPVASGVYFYTIRAGDNYTATKKMVVAR